MGGARRGIEESSVRFQSVRMLLAGVSMAVALPQQAGAESATDRSVNAVAGLHPMIELNCTPVNLGVWRVPKRNAGGTTRIMLDIDRAHLGAQISQNTAVARASGHPDWEPAFGVCTVTQSRALDQSSAVVTIQNNRLLKVVPDANAFTAVPAGRANSALRIDVYAPTLTRISNGTSTFLIGGGITIPEKIIDADYGAYRTATRPLVSVDDRMR